LVKRCRASLCTQTIAAAFSDSDGDFDQLELIDFSDDETKIPETPVVVQSSLTPSQLSMRMSNTSAREQADMILNSRARSQPATPRPLSPLPVLGLGFDFQADVLIQLKRIVSSEIPGSLLVIQPTSSGKGKYARELDVGCRTYIRKIEVGLLVTTSYIALDIPNIHHAQLLVDMGATFDCRTYRPRNFSEHYLDT
jgi:hypothetical protein